MELNADITGGKTAGDIILLKKMIVSYCAAVHDEEARVSSGNPDLPAVSEFSAVELCRDCMNLLEYASRKRKNCVKDPKPSCRNCDTPCYTTEYREKIKAVMSFGRLCNGR